jgi:hypothetical protein
MPRRILPAESIATKPFPIRCPTRHIPGSEIGH